VAQRFDVEADVGGFGRLGHLVGHPVRGSRVRGLLTIVTPTAAKMVSKALVNLASRSRIRKRKQPVGAAREAPVVT
jgi:hypothetical protein